MYQQARGFIFGGMSTTTRRNDVARVDAAELVWILATIGLCLVGFGLLALYEYEHRGALLPSSGTGVLFTVGGVALVGALVVRVMGRGK